MYGGAFVQGAPFFMLKGKKEGDFGYS